MEAIKEESRAVGSEKYSTYKHYDLNDRLYSRKYLFQDIFPHKERYTRFNNYDHSGLFDIATSRPTFVGFLETHGYTEVWKAFKFFNLEDATEEIRSSYSGAVVDQFFRIIDLYLSSTSRETLATVYKQSNRERVEAKSFFEDKKISFSADPWDIATMSMRGITSCMSWHNSHSVSLSGSILDPYCGLISLCNKVVYHGSTFAYGNGTVARAVVRLVRDNNSHHKLLLERLYLADKDIPVAQKSLIIEVFKDYLEKKSNLQVLEGRNNGIVIPYFNHLPALSEATRSYRDSGVEYESRLEPT